MTGKLIFLLLIVACPVRAAEVTIIPGDVLHLNATNPGKSYADLVAHSILVTTSGDETFEVTGIEIDLMQNGQVVLSKSPAPARLVEETQGIAQMVAQGMGVFLEAQILTKGGTDTLFDRKLGFATTPALESNQMLMLGRQHFSLDFVPDELRVTASGYRGKEPVRITASVPVRVHNSPIAYTLPLQGAWLMTSLPSIESHHRLNPPTEFAVDFFKTTAEGKLYSGDVLDPASFVGFGADVLAAADGEVVFVIADEVQDRSAYLPKPGESRQQTDARIRFYNMRRYAADLKRASAGNIVTVRHEVEGLVEYSSYGHLKSGSVRVAVGDIVKRGQVIAEVGDTGDSNAVHLHFQINAGPDVFVAKSLPVTFSNIKRTTPGLDAGLFVETIPARSQQNLNAGAEHTR